MARDEDDRSVLAEFQRKFDEAAHDPNKAREMFRDALRRSANAGESSVSGGAGELARRTRRLLMNACKGFWNTLASVLVVGLLVRLRARTARARFQFEALSSSSPVLLESISGIVAVAMLAGVFVGGGANSSERAPRPRADAIAWRHVQTQSTPVARVGQRARTAASADRSIDAAVASDEIAKTPAGALAQANFDDQAEWMVLTYYVGVEIAGQEYELVEGHNWTNCKKIPKSSEAIRRTVCTTHSLSPNTGNN